tara:strand:- start:671 stop:943 length:273 start_codon:yes stop_codon:yes gene_type:complete
MGKKINLIGGSNLYTNSTLNFGSMAGLPGTTNTRPFFVARHYNSYYYDKSMKAGCHLKTPAEGKECLRRLNIYEKAHVLADPVHNRNILG